MEQRSELKSARLLEIYTRLEQGRTLKKADLAQEFHVTQRSIQRDVELPHGVRQPAGTD